MMYYDLFSLPSLASIGVPEVICQWIGGGPTRSFNNNRGVTGGLQGSYSGPLSNRLSILYQALRLLSSLSFQHFHIMQHSELSTSI